jgi:hypothetical protein
MSNILLDLGTQPLVGNLCLSKDASLHAKKYPLKAYYNEDLKISIDTEIEPRILYEKYSYHSGVSKPYIKHCEDMYASFKHLKSNTIIDIGGNDGTLLKTFKRLEATNNNSTKFKAKRYINVDASKSFSSININSGIEYKQAYFSDKIDLPKADIITSTNVFQHTKDVDSFLKGIVKHLDGVWILEFPYTLNTIHTLQFDQFYHEHYYYWLLTPLEKLFNNYGLKIIYLAENSIHGGSMRIWTTMKDISAPKPIEAINSYKNKESKLKLESFNKDVYDYIKKAKDYIFNLPGKTIFFGAAHKGCVFLNSLGININNMPDSYIVDDTEAKQGLYIPGTGFKIYSRDKLLKDDVKNIIILPHNFGKHIASSLRYDGNRKVIFKGQLITMLPRITLH